MLRGFFTNIQTFPIGTDLMKRAHDGVFKEYQAEKGQEEFQNFNKFISKNYKSSISKLFNDSKNDEEIINQIDEWYKIYKDEKNDK